MNQYDLIVVGTGFGSSFFLSRYLQYAPKNAKVLVLERGKNNSLDWQIVYRRNSALQYEDTFTTISKNNKRWIYTPNFGGGSNCWWGCTPRMLPNDFRLASKYGVGVDWPISYDDLETFYCDAEELMSISGDSTDTPFRRSRPYPQPPHRFTKPEEVLKAAFPDTFFHQPTARSRVGTAKRAACCASSVCHLCPVKAKFTVQNDMAEVYQDPRVTLEFEARVDSLEMAGGEVKGVVYYQDRPKKAMGEMVVLGANALFNPHIMMRSGIDHKWLGKGLNEQASKVVVVELDGLDNFQGSTSLTGHGYMLYDGEHRKDHAAMLIETQNVPNIRLEQGKWQQRLVMKFIAEDLPSRRNYVSLDRTQPEKPVAVYEGHSDYTERAFDSLEKTLPQMLSALPIERIEIPDEPVDTEAHIQGTTRMGHNPDESVIDANLVHHQYRNLVVVGSGVFPSCPPANPSLTIAALSLRSADKLFAPA